MHESVVRDRAVVAAPSEVPDELVHGRSRIDLEARTGLVGRSTAMRRVRRELLRYAAVSAPVVIHGETGTGKELVARALHRLGPRHSRPYVAANVAAIPEGTAASELFGHERGAFTGAVTVHRGLFEQAERGTLFLDEIAELEAPNQARLLRALESGEIRPVGGERTRVVNTRLVVASHTELLALVRRGYFREDLFFRLHTLVVDLPPLRHRIEDVPALAAHLLARLVPEVGERGLDASALRPLQDYGWPGNVRQLGNVLRRAAIRSDAHLLGDDEIAESLSFEPRAVAYTADGATVATIRETFRAKSGNISATARVLGCARSTLRMKLKKHAIAL